ncbi:Coatomer, beta' subunit [Prunus dulcis]|uniref:Coatomer, beta' subunit n=1 Tax=Prunus dulcis TaxID=3755 RepID=A0A4Y1R4M6_PRUDU|nr:Coatomer, beta' subunit [Prunus dulcis]
MPLSLTIEKEFAQNSERVKSVDQHPTEPWILVSLYSGTLCIWNYQSQTMEKSFKVTESPVRSAKFVARENWVVTRLMTSYKLWDWEKDWSCTQIFEGHSHYVMQVAFNPKDTNTFASASLDGTIKIWNIGSPTAEFTLDGHSKGVWDIETKSCVQTLEGHEHNVTAVCVHAELPIIITVSEDGNIHIWNATTFWLENKLNYGLERVWAIGQLKGSNKCVSERMIFE